MFPLDEITMVHITTEECSYKSFPCICAWQTIEQLCLSSSNKQKNLYWREIDAHAVRYELSSVLLAHVDELPPMGTNPDNTLYT